MNKRGFSVIEFVIASSLTVALVATVTLSTSSIQRNLSKNRVKTQITLYAQNLLETARAFNCGSEVIPDQVENINGESKKIFEACNNEFVTVGTNQQVDPSFGCSSNGGYQSAYKEWSPCLSGSLVENDEVAITNNFTNVTKIQSVKFSSQWLTQIDDSVALNNNNNIESCTNIFNKLINQPSLLRNTVKIIYKDPYLENKVVNGVANDIRVYEYSDLIAYPNNIDIYEEDLSVLFVLARNNQKTASITGLNNQSNSITREGILCLDNSIESYGIIFPYLKEGSYSIRDSNGTGEVVNIPANKRCRFSIGGGGITCL